MNALSRRRGIVFQSLSGLIALAMVVLPATQVFGQIIDQVSGDAVLVIKAHDLKSTSDKIAGLAQQMGLVPLSPQWADPLGTVQTLTNIKAGIDTAGDAAFVVLDLFPGAGGGGGAPGANGGNGGDAGLKAYFLMPITDYTAFLTNFKDVKKDGDLDTFHYNAPNAPDTDLYGAHWGNYAAFSDKKELLAKKPAGLKLSPAVQRQWEAGDLVVLANMKQLGPKLLQQMPALAVMAEQAQQAITANADSKYHPAIKVAVKQIMAGMEEFLKDTTAAALSVKLSADGIGTSWMVDFEPASYLGQMVKSVKVTDAPLLKGLPDAKYILLGGTVVDGVAMYKAFEDAVAPILKELPAGAPDQKPLSDLMAVIKKTLATEKSGAFGMVAPTGALGAASLLQQIGVIEGDATVLLDAQRDSVEFARQVQALTTAREVGIKMELAFKENAKTVDGVAFNEFTQTCNAAGDNPAAQMAKQMFTTMYGPNGQQTFAGKLDANHIVFGGGVDDAMLSALIKSARDQSDAMDKTAGVVEAAKHLPATRAAAFYFDVGTAVATVTNYAQAMGMPLPFKIPADLAPVGVSLSTDGSAVKVDTYASSKLLSSVFSVFENLLMGKAPAPGT